jgi:hypothetical protein
MHRGKTRPEVILVSGEIPKLLISACELDAEIARKDEIFSLSSEYVARLRSAHWFVRCAGLLSRCALILVYTRIEIFQVSRRGVGAAGQ